MKLLLKAVFHHKKHVPLVVLTLVTLFFLTIASSLEMFALGVISDTGTDLFKNAANKKQEKVVSSRSRKIVSSAKPIAVKGSEKEKVNPLNWVIQKLKHELHMQRISLGVIGVVLAFIVLLKALALFYSRFTTQLLSIRISKDLRQRYFEHIQKLPMPFYQKYNIGTLSSRVATDASQIAVSLNAFITNYFHTPFRIAITLVTCFWISWQLSLVIFIGLPMIVLPVIFLTRRVKRITRQLQKNQEKFTSVLIDFLAGIQTVKIFSMEPFTLSKYKEQNDHMAVLETKTAKYDLLIRPILHTITILCVIGIVVFGLYVLKMTLSELLMFCGFLHQFYEPVKKFSEENAIIQKGVVAAERLFEVMKLDPHTDNKEKALPLISFDEKIEFDRVWFRYDDHWILKDISFSVKKGETVALVGATGAGKSTIVNLLPRLYEIEQGEIRIDGISIKSLTKKSLRDKISFVPQKPFLFYDTVAANIAFGRDFSLERIAMAAKKAHADEFIECLPKRYDTLLSEMGKNLSGGQQQRLAIARALVKNAPILILDEATSSLDSISELRIKDAIANLHGSITQILIAHRLSTIEHADKIIFLEKGEILATGTKDELLHSCPQFRMMWETHFRASKKTDILLETKSMLTTVDEDTLS
ncbi:MAG: Vitamin B12 import ATP-binding protein BtuD [Chlamydiia bacterium]|nr:Vitamin B12 import ATP-binding protein BtuD [Chlamydiia bacterium]